MPTITDSTALYASPTHVRATASSSKPADASAAGASAQSSTPAKGKRKEGKPASSSSGATPSASTPRASSAPSQQKPSSETSSIPSPTRASTSAPDREPAPEAAGTTAENESAERHHLTAEESEEAAAAAAVVAQLQHASSSSEFAREVEPTAGPSSHERARSSGTPNEAHGEESQFNLPETDLETVESNEKNRKESHKEVERRRRQAINHGINTLCDIVPGCAPHMFKGSIIAAAANYIHELKQSEASNIEKWTLQKLMMDQMLSDLSGQLEQAKLEIARLQGIIAGRGEGEEGDVGKDGTEEPEEEREVTTALPPPETAAEAIQTAQGQGEQEGPAGADQNKEDTGAEQRKRAVRFEADDADEGARAAKRVKA